MPPRPRTPAVPPYVELHCLSNFSFLRGASHPEELVARAAALGYRGLALTDECSLAGAVRAHRAARALERPDFRLLLGAELRLEDGPALVLLAADAGGYGDLCRLISRARRRAPKGRYALRRADLEAGPAGCLALYLPGPAPDRWDEEAGWVAQAFPGRAWLAVELLRAGDDRRRCRRLLAAAARAGLPACAAGDVHMHVRGRRALQDVLTAIRLGLPLARAGLALFPNGERHLRRPEVLARLYPPALLEETLAVAARCRFSLDEIRYTYPRELVPAGTTPHAHLRALVEAGMRRRWPDGAPPKVRALVEGELALIRELGYEPYFLTVHDIVAFARARGILCQGRGSAANSAVCYCLGITEVDPSRLETLFERFISKERNEPPDIDVDFEHRRREEVIQYIYKKYGRERAALAATVICYRPRSAVRDVAKALGLAPEEAAVLARAARHAGREGLTGDLLREAGLDPRRPELRRLRVLVRDLIGFPRHLSQHVGGFVISETPLDRLVPIENAAMPGRTVIQWDKDDLDSLGLLKVDCLALGMLTVIRRALDLAVARRGRPFTLQDIPPEDPAVYAMLQRADAVGVFQVESRAQMAMLPRLRPACFYDLVIQVAIVRPGPIQGDMVHPYLRRRQGLEPVEYPSEEVRGVLARTLGVPIFQEQVIKLAMVAAGFSGGEADRLRRSMAAWRRRGGLEHFERKLVDGMRRRGYPEDFARQIFRQILGFGEYGFPESHAASFALLVYVSAWLKCHEPEAFLCALLNSQPMGFYAPSQLVQDARRHGVEVRPVDVTASQWDCTLESGARYGHRRPAVRLGLRLVKGLSRGGAERLVRARGRGAFAGVAELARRAGLDRRDLEALAAAGALKRLAGHRRRARWAAAGAVDPGPLLAGAEPAEAVPLLKPPGEGEDIRADYASLGLSLGRHPLALLRPRLARAGFLAATDLQRHAGGDPVRVAGLVTCRQAPRGPKGVVFVTLEDETGSVQVIVWPRLAARRRWLLSGARLLGVRGRLQREGEVIHVLARNLEDHSALLGDLTVAQRDFR